jgi:pimeloyl-ACP methyl ester carboxylesterase
MPTYTRDGIEIYYEEYGNGYPLMLFAPGGVRSTISFWHSTPETPRAWMDPTVVLSAKFRVIAMDQRNAGQSRAPIRAGDGWQNYADDHLALMDHLGIKRCHVMGGCIGSSFSLTLCERAPQRISAAVLQNPIGFANNRHVFAETFGAWAKAMRERDPTLDQATLDAFSKNMFGGDFVFSVGRNAVSHCAVPLLVMPGDDPPHPAAIGEEIGRLAPKAEMHREWKGPAHLAGTVARVAAFLTRYTT